MIYHSHACMCLSARHRTIVTLSPITTPAIMVQGGESATNAPIYLAQVEDDDTKHP